jgi:hypothetical protein
MNPAPGMTLEAISERLDRVEEALLHNDPEGLETATRELVQCMMATVPPSATSGSDGFSEAGASERLAVLAAARRLSALRGQMARRAAAVNLSLESLFPARPAGSLYGNSGARTGHVSGGAAYTSVRA